jgi:hypothetical protein
LEIKGAFYFCPNFPLISFLSVPLISFFSSANLLNELEGLNGSLGKPNSRRAASTTLSEERGILADAGRRSCLQHFAISRPKKEHQSLDEEDDEVNDRDCPPGIVAPRNPTHKYLNFSSPSPLSYPLTSISSISSLFVHTSASLSYSSHVV